MSARKAPPTSRATRRSASPPPSGSGRAPLTARGGGSAHREGVGPVLWAFLPEPVQALVLQSERELVADGHAQVPLPRLEGRDALRVVEGDDHADLVSS